MIKIEHLTESLNRKYKLNESTSNTIKDYSWPKFIEKIEAVTGFKVDSSYKRKYNQWIELIDDNGNIRDAEVTKYFDGEYELHPDNISTYIHEEYSLVGQDGNAFSLMGYTARCMKECGLRDEIDEMRKLAMSGDYYNLIRVCDDYIQKCNEINPDLDEAYTLTEKKWTYTLENGGRLRKAIRNEDYEEIIESIYDCYKELRNNNIIDEEDYRNYTEELDMYVRDDFMSWDDPEEIINYELNDLYDLCDNLNVWVSLDESLNEEAQKEVFDKPGEFWYFTKHGVGPGSVPKEITIEKTIDKDGGEYFLIKDKILSTDALNKYEIKEKSPDDIEEDWKKPEGDFAGWVAQFQGKRIEITKDEANSLYDAKLKAIEKLKVPKSKIGLLSIQPGYNESYNGKDVDNMTFEEMLDLYWKMNGQWAPYDMGMEPDEIDAYFRENPDALKLEVEEGIKWYE